jgi:ADP-ribosylglycohydrolase
MDTAHEGPLDRAHASLDGLSIGDAFGECLFHDEQAIELRLVPPPRWVTTDDTEMAIAVVDVLRRHGGVEQDALASAFAGRHAVDPYRGYGPAAHDILHAIHSGRSWKEVAGEAFGGKGSMGNGSAMRVAPLGAYFADDEELLIQEAEKSAKVTHAHLDGQAGAIAVAAAAGWAVRGGGEARELFKAVLTATPPGPTRDAIARASQLPLDADPLSVALQVGAGWNTLCADTVPFCLWVVAHSNDFCEALWTTVSVPGDRDTNCAIVGGVVGALTGREGIPDDWLAAREPLRHDLDLAAD